MLVLILGCSSAEPAAPAPPQPAPPRHVELGMAASRVEALMGKPKIVQQVAADPGMQVWVYNAGRVVLNNGKVVLTDPAPLPVR